MNSRCVLPHHDSLFVVRDFFFSTRQVGLDMLFALRLQNRVKIVFKLVEVCFAALVADEPKVVEDGIAFHIQAIFFVCAGVIEALLNQLQLLEAFLKLFQVNHL